MNINFKIDWNYIMIAENEDNHDIWCWNKKLKQTDNRID